MESSTVLDGSIEGNCDALNIVQLTPGAGAMYCGNCLRDNALVACLRRMGHSVTMVPLYLPLTLDEPDQSASTPVFFGGISVYLQQQSPLFRSAPDWFHNLLASRSILKWAAGRAAKTRAADVGELTLSILRGEHGNQARELEALVSWLRQQPRPDVICLSNALLLGLAPRLKQALGSPVICMLQGEDSFLDQLPEGHRAECWQTVAELASQVDRLVAPSHYFADLMRKRLRLAPSLVQVVHNGINLSGYHEVRREMPSGSPPVVGFFTRMCPEKGLHTLLEAWLLLRERRRVPGVKLKVGGSCGPADEPFVQELVARITNAGLVGEVEFHRNVDRTGKLAFLRSLSVFSVPALYGEAFGLYVLEAMGAGVPVVQPRTAAFTELVEATGGGVLCESGSAEDLCQTIEALLLAPDRCRQLGEAGRKRVAEGFSAEAMAQRMLHIFESARTAATHQPGTTGSR